MKIVVQVRVLLRELNKLVRITSDSIIDSCLSCGTIVELRIQDGKAIEGIHYVSSFCEIYFPYVPDFKFEIL